MRPKKSFKITAASDQHKKEDKMTLSKDLLDILRCPKCKGEIRLNSDSGLICDKCALLYEIKEGIPVMLIDRAQPIS